MKLRYLTPLLLFTSVLSVQVSAESIQEILSGKYVLEIPYEGLDPRFKGEKHYYDLTLNQDGTYVLYTQEPVVKWMQNIKTGDLHEELSVLHLSSNGNYTVDGNAVTLSQGSPIERLEFIGSTLSYEGKQFKKITEANKRSERDGE